LLDLDDPAGVAQLRALAAAGHVFLQAYRPGALASRGLGPEALAAVAPGIVCVSLAAWGHTGPWAGRRGFDSLVQTATGFNVAEAATAGRDTPMALPVQILDHAAGHLLAFGALAALRRQALEGGSWQVQVSLARTGLWLRSLGQDAAGLAAVMPAPALEEEDSGFGRLSVLPPAVRFGGRLLRGVQPAMPPGSHPPAWADPPITATA
jgi:crotonobetainyl-CoA:carnitine CoA-transferase CaiB-like acyl-CoA transferase